MLRDEEIDNIRQSVTMRQLAVSYGYKIYRSGMICCPFHDDKKPSMKIYDGDRGYYCFVCNEGGNIFNFVMKHDGLEFEPAVRRIAGMFGIPLSDGKSGLTEADRQRIAENRAKREAAQKERKANQERLNELTNQLHALHDAQAEFEPMGAAWSAIQRQVEKTEREWDYRFEKGGSGHE